MDRARTTDGPWGGSAIGCLCQAAKYWQPIFNETSAVRWRVIRWSVRVDGAGGLTNQAPGSDGKLGGLELVNERLSFSARVAGPSQGHDGRIAETCRMTCR